MMKIFAKDLPKVMNKFAKDLPKVMNKFVYFLKMTK
jgi:hypothetical protein